MYNEMYLTIVLIILYTFRHENEVNTWELLRQWDVICVTAVKLFTMEQFEYGIYRFVTCADVIGHVTCVIV